MPLYTMDLRKYIRSAPSPISFRNGKTIISQLSSAVAYLHENQFMHRDIKPSTILIKCQPLAAVLGDFGSAKAFLPGLPMTRKICTLWHRAPEVLANKEACDLSSDVWSLGVTFVEIELGQAPFQHSSEMGMLQHIMHTCGGSLAVGETMTKQNAGSHPWGQRYGPRFQDFIDAMLVVEPARRKSAESCARCSSLMSHSQAPDSRGSSSRWQGSPSRWQGP
jgi:serine/threonine protein kinase